MPPIVSTLLKSVLLLLGCFIVLLVGGLNRADSPLALRVAGIVAAVYFIVRSLSYPATTDRAAPPRYARSALGTAAGGAGAGVATSAMTSTAEDDSWTSFAHDQMHMTDTIEINPANGLPMVGGVDVMGNTYGTDSSTSFDSIEINPANGLPMDGGIDVMGNTYGTDSSTSFDSFGGSYDSYDSFDNSHNSFGNSSF
jgi:hypothetical protein